MKKSKIAKRQEFLTVYSHFTDWLITLGFRMGHYWKESATPLDVQYSHFKVDSLYGVEHYIHDVLKISIRFLRERNSHTFFIVNGFMELSIGLTLSEFKNLILENVHQTKSEMMTSLTSIPC